MRALLVLSCCCVLAALPGCGKSETGADAAAGGSSAGQAPGGTQAGTSTGGSGSGAVGGANGAAGSAAHGGNGPAAGGVAVGGGGGGSASDGGAAPGQGGEQAEAGAGPGEGGASGLVDCNPTHTLCRSLPPECAAMQVPSIVGTCWGPCVKIDSCRCSSAQECPDSNQFTCWRSEHCGPYVQ